MGRFTGYVKKRMKFLFPVSHRLLKDKEQNGYVTGALIKKNILVLTEKKFSNFQQFSTETSLNVHKSS